MKKAIDITGITVTLKIDKTPALFVLLTADGAVNRIGTGTIDNNERDMFIGQTDGKMFISLRNCITDDMLKFTGGYDIPNQMGASCRLSVELHFKDGSEDGFGFSYGAESKGPPHEISNVVIKAVELTDPWYQQQKDIASGQAKKPKWKFW